MRKIAFYISLLLAFFSLCMIFVYTHDWNNEYYFKYNEEFQKYEPIELTFPRFMEQGCEYAVYENGFEDVGPYDIRIIKNDQEELDWEYCETCSERLKIKIDNCSKEKMKIVFDLVNDQLPKEISKKFYIMNYKDIGYSMETGTNTYLAMNCFIIFILIAFLIKFFDLRKSKKIWQQIIFWLLVIVVILSVVLPFWINFELFALWVNNIFA